MNWSNPWITGHHWVNLNEYRLSPKKYNWTFSINNFRNCKLIWICFRIMKLSLDYLHHGENPNRFGPVVTTEIRIFVRRVRSSFHPSFDTKETRTTQLTHNSVLALNCLCRFIYKTWMENIYDKHNKNPYFFVTTGPNRTGFSPK